MQPCSRAAVQPCSRAAMQPCSLAALQPCGLAAFQPCGRAALQPCSRAAVQPCSCAAVQPCSRAAVQPCSTSLQPGSPGQQPCSFAALWSCGPNEKLQNLRYQQQSYSQATDQKPQRPSRKQALQLQAHGLDACMSTTTHVYKFMSWMHMKMVTSRQRMQVCVCSCFLGDC